MERRIAAIIYSESVKGTTLTAEQRQSRNLHNAFSRLKPTTKQRIVDKLSTFAEQWPEDLKKSNISSSEDFYEFVQGGIEPYADLKGAKALLAKIKEHLLTCACEDMRASNWQGRPSPNAPATNTQATQEENTQEKPEEKLPYETYSDPEVNYICDKMWERYDALFKEKPSGKTISHKKPMPLHKANQMNMEFRRKNDALQQEFESATDNPNSAEAKRKLILHFGYNFWAAMGKKYAEDLKTLESQIRTIPHISAGKLRKITGQHLRFPELNAPETAHIDAKIMDWILSEMIFDYQEAPYTLKSQESIDPPDPTP